MQNFVLNNGVAFKTVPPITYPNSMAKTRTICFQTDLSYDEVFNLLSDYNNICKISCTFDSGNVADIITDCAGLKVLSKKADGTYMAEMSTDTTERLIQELQAKVEQLEQQNNELKQRVETLLADKEENTDEPEEIPEEEPDMSEDPEIEPETPDEETEKIPNEDTDETDTDNEEDLEP